MPVADRHELVRPIRSRSRYRVPDAWRRVRWPCRCRCSQASGKRAPGALSRATLRRCMAAFVCRRGRRGAARDGGPALAPRRIVLCRSLAAGALLGATGVLWRARSPRRLRSSPTGSTQALAFVTSGTTVLGVWTISILGDGYGELRRHVHLADLAALWSWGVLLLAILGARDWAARAAWLAIPAFGALVGIAAAHAMPLALGYVERYDGSTAKGWVIASLPMRQVRLLRPGAASPVVLDDTDASADLARHFAIPELAQARRWHAEIDANGRCIPLTLRVDLDAVAVGELDALAFALGPGDAMVPVRREPRCMLSRSVRAPPRKAALAKAGSHPGSAEDAR